MPSLHRHTPSLTALDPRGANVRAVAYHRLSAEDEPVARVTRNVFGATGFLQQQWDPRLHALRVTDARVKPNLSHRYSLCGQVLHTGSVDAGWRVSLLGCAGQPVQYWDGRGGRQRHEYDPMLRPVAVYEQTHNESSERCVEYLTYAEATLEHAALNCCGRFVRHEDPAGRVSYEHYGLNGAITGQSRRMVKAQSLLSWPKPEKERERLLESESFTTAWHYNAVGALLEQVDAKGNRRFSQYAVDGKLSRMELQLRSGIRKVLVEHRVYNAQGKLTSERAGNGTVTLSSYNERDGRLQRLQVYRSQKMDSVLQDLAYGYDRIGNVTRIHDAAQPSVWFSNARIDAVSRFGYDTLYQLVKATGRENTQNLHGADLPGVVLFGTTQNAIWGNYTRHYHYDTAGNLLQMQHVPSAGPGYTRRMRVAARSNHSLLEIPGGGPVLAEGFDPCGNQQTLAAGQVMSWNLRNQLTQVTQVRREDGDPDEETYTYDGAGQRALKRRLSKAKSQIHTREVVYLPGLELRRDHASGQWLTVLSVETGRSTVRVLQWEKGRPAQIDDEQLRFSVSDMTGSSTLELDEQAALLSQEGYYPYGATAWWAARSAIEATFKTIRHSGKELDATGLYYYGYRYYAPWLQRWINPDPAGVIDGLNLFCMVRNNPVSLRDSHGRQSQENDDDYSEYAPGAMSSGYQQSAHSFRRRDIDEHAASARQASVVSGLSHKVYRTHTVESVYTAPLVPGAYRFKNEYLPGRWRMMENFRAPGEGPNATDVTWHQYEQVSRQNNFFGVLPKVIVRWDVINKEALRATNEQDGMLERFLASEGNGRSTQKIMNAFGLRATGIERREVHDVRKGLDVDIIAVHVEPAPLPRSKSQDSLYKKDLRKEVERDLRRMSRHPLSRAAHAVWRAVKRAVLPHLPRPGLR